MLIFLAALVDENHQKPTEEDSLHSFQGSNIDVERKCDILVRVVIIAVPIPEYRVPLRRGWTLL